MKRLMDINLKQPSQPIILAVDTQIHMLKLLERIVKEKTPYRILTTTNSLEVPDLLTEEQFDLVISDLKMPGFNGIDLLKMVKERKGKEKVVIITASGDFESVIECMSLGAYFYIVKPFSKEQIISVVETAMQIKSDKAEAELLAELLDNLQFAAATKRFENEYIERLSIRYAGDISKMTEAAGLSNRQLSRLLKANSDHYNKIPDGIDNSTENTE